MQNTGTEYRLRFLTAERDAPKDVALDPAHQLIIGRGVSCDIRLRDRSVSRSHTLLGVDSNGDWCVYDLRSHNGTFVNGRRIAAGTVLRPDDELRLGPHGPAFSFEQRARANVGLVPQQREHLGGRSAPTVPSLESFQVSSILPIFTQVKIRRIALETLLPGFVAIIVATLLVIIPGAQRMWFHFTIAAYLLFLTVSEIRRLTGRAKPWRVLLLAAATSGIVATLVGSVINTVVTHDVLLRQLLHAWNQRHLFVVPEAFTEELIKALPLVIGLAVGLTTSSLALRAPLDGIVIGAASAAGFELFHVLWTYGLLWFPSLSADGSCWSAGSAQDAVLPGIIADITSDVAYTGFLGYLVGLAASKMDAQALMIYGLLGFTAVGLVHSLSSGICAQPNSPLRLPLVLLIGIGSFVMLIAAITRARREAGLSVPLSSAVGTGRRR